MRPGPQSPARKEITVSPLSSAGKERLSQAHVFITKNHFYFVFVFITYHVNRGTYTSYFVSDFLLVCLQYIIMTFILENLHIYILYFKHFKVVMFNYDAYETVHLSVWVKVGM